MASRDEKEVFVGSRLNTDLIAKFYQKYLKMYAKGKLLDLGCGKVPLYSAYKDYITDNTCVDWANTLHKNEHLDYECDLNQALPFKEAQYNSVILSDVLEHILVPGLLVKEIARVLSPEGILLMNVPFYYSLHEEPHDFYRYTEFALRYLMESSGFEVIELIPTGGAPEIIADICAKNITRIPVIGKSLAVFSQWFTKLFVSIYPGNRISRASAKKFPFGYFLVAKKVCYHLHKQV